MPVVEYNTDQLSVDWLYRPATTSAVGMCTCGNCQYCGYKWAPPVSFLITSGANSVDDLLQAELAKSEAKTLTDKARQIFASLKPKYKLHADGRCTYIHGKADLLDSETYKRVTRASF